MPISLDSRAVGLAHEFFQAGKPINVAEVARMLGVERTKLYRGCPGFQAMVTQDRASAERAKKRRPRGSKDGETGQVEAWHDED